MAGLRLAGRRPQTASLAVDLAGMRRRPDGEWTTAIKQALIYDIAKKYRFRGTQIEQLVQKTVPGA